MTIISSSRSDTAAPPSPAKSAGAFFGGALVGTLGGLIGLGGAEFRLPLLIGLFGFVALEAVILNKAISLVVVASALAFRSQVVPVASFSSTGRPSPICWRAVLSARGLAPASPQDSRAGHSTG